jgi:hypothetical protein
MANLHVDIIEGGRANQTTRGWELERVAIVTGAEGEGPNKIINASFADGMPQWGDPHPAVPTAWLAERTGEAVDTDTVKFRLRYQEWPETTGGGTGPPIPEESCPITVGTNVQQDTTNQDIWGNTIFLRVSYPSDDPDEAMRPTSTNTAGTHDVVAETSVLRPDTTISITYTETDSPMYKSNWYVGTTNIGGWSLHPEAAPDTWLCTGITGTSPNVFTPYEVTYTFAYKETGWNPKMSFKRRDNGSVPTFADDGIGKNVDMRVYWQTDFNDLDL